MSHGADQPHRICFARLSNNRSLVGLKKMWAELQPLLQGLVSSLTVIEVIGSIPIIKRAEFKSLSNLGAIYMGNGRQRDFGNWTYSIVYWLMWEFAHGTPLMQMLTTSAQRYPSLHPDAGYTETSVSMQGDVIELILEKCRLTGPAIEQSVREDRLHTSLAFRELVQRIETLLWVISDHEYVWVRDRPAPSVCVAEFRRRLAG